MKTLMMFLMAAIGFVVGLGKAKAEVTAAQPPSISVLLPGRAASTRSAFPSDPDDRVWMAGKGRK